MEEQLKAALEMNIELLQRVAALQIVVTALLRCQPEGIRRSAEEQAAVIAAAAVGRHGVGAEGIQTMMEQLLIDADPGSPGSSSPS